MTARDRRVSNHRDSDSHGGFWVRSPGVIVRQDERAAERRVASGSQIRQVVDWNIEFGDDQFTEVLLAALRRPKVTEGELAEAMLVDWCGSNPTLQSWQREHNYKRWIRAAHVALEMVGRK